MNQITYDEAVDHLAAIIGGTHKNIDTLYIMSVLSMNPRTHADCVLKLATFGFQIRAIQQGRPRNSNNLVQLTRAEEDKIIQDFSSIDLNTMSLAYSIFAQVDGSTMVKIAREASCKIISSGMDVADMRLDHSEGIDRAFQVNEDEGDDFEFDLSDIDLSFLRGLS